MKTILSNLLVILIIILAQPLSAQWQAYTTSNSDIPFDKVICVESDLQNNIWVGNSVSGGYGHISCFDQSAWLSDFYNGWVYDITVDAAGSVWTCYNGDLKEWSGTAWNDYTSNLLGYWMMNIHADNNGNVWMVNSSSNSLIKFDGTNFTEITSAMGLPSNNITCFESDSNNIIIGTSDTGFVYYDGTNWNHYTAQNSNLPDNNVKAMRMKDNALWVVSGGGNLTKFESTGFATYIATEIEGSVKEFDIDDFGNIWFAVYNYGVVKFDGTNWHTYNNATYSFFDIYDQYLCLDVDGNNNVWVGTQSNGLLRYDPATAGIGNIDENIQLSIHPNPAYDYIVLKADGISSNYDLTIYDLNGREVITANSLDADNNETVNISNLNIGTYIVNIRSEEKTIIRKLVIQ